MNQVKFALEDESSSSDDFDCDDTDSVANVPLSEKSMKHPK